VLSVRDYFVERVEHSKMPPVPKDLVRKRPVSTVPNEPDDNDEDPEDDTALPDDWVTAYLQVKRLRYIQRAS
jgi:hypothetical protein